MKPGIALAAALIAAGGLAVPVQAHSPDRGQRGGQQHTGQDSRPGWQGHGNGRDQRRDQWRDHEGQGRYAPRFGYGYPRYYGYRPQYEYPRYYRPPPRYRYYRYDHDYDDDYGYYDYDDDYRGFDDSRIGLLISLPLRF